MDWKLGLTGWLVVGGAIALGCDAYGGRSDRAFAQSNIVPDNSLGVQSSVVTPNVDINGIKSDRIDGGAIQGANLFHSFGEFNINEGRGAYFTNPAGIENIFSRVTGGNRSEIFGKLGVLGNANLFLINPSGIIFGRNASLDVRGSFVGTTASSLNFADGIKFSADSPQTTPLLTVSVPLGLQFGGNAGNIVNQSQATDSSGLVTGLKVRGNTLALVGGDVKLDGGILQAPGGRVELGGLSGAGTVGLNISDRNFSLNFPVNAALASVSLTDSADVNVVSSGGGSIAVNARNIDVLGGSSLRAGISLNSQADGAQAGDITLKATGTLNIENSSIYNIAFGAGNGGNLLIDTGKLIVRDGIVTTGTVSQGRAGNLIVKAKDSVELKSSNTSNGTVSAKIPVNIFGVSDFPVSLPIGLFSASLDARNIIPSNSNFNIFLPTAGGNAGNLMIKTGRLIVQDGAVISAGTTTAGNAGNLTVKADFIELSGTSANPAPTGFEFLNILGKVSSGLINGTTDTGSGSSGKLSIETGQLIVSKGARLATTTVGTTGGELMVNAAESVELSGTSANGFPSLLTSATRGSGDASPLTINTKRLIVRDGAIISAGTTGSGKGGELTINATEFVKLIGTSKTDLSASDLQTVLGVRTGKVFTEGSIPSGVITGTFGEGNASNLTINTGRLLIQGGAQASVSSLGTGNAGSLIVNASSIELSGTSGDRPDPNDIVGRSLLTTAVGSNSTGQGGNIDITTNTLSVDQGAAISVSNEGTQDAGSLKITANSIKLDQGRLVGTTALRQGGNITLNIADLLLMRHNSQISTTAGTAQAGGNGGNITINSPDGFVAAVPDENSDITANAFSGSGGQVTINATGIFGIAPLSRQELERLRPNDLDPRQLITNDITAISQTSPNLSGTVTINTPDVDPNRGLVNLPTVPLQSEVSQVCQPRTAENQSSFIITGRGGLPPNPRTEPLSGDAVQVDWVTLKPRGENRANTNVSKPISPTPAPIVEAQGWVRNAKGEVVLTAYVPTATPHNSWQTPAFCHGS